MHARFSQILSLIMLPIFSSSLYASDIADAAQQQDTAAVQLLLTSGVDVNEPQNDGATALLWAAQWDDLAFAWQVCAVVSSNAIVFAKDQQAFGIGAGQQNRLDSARIAAERSAGRALGGVCASDAFFPFRDGLDATAAAGIKAVIQPGGSVRDEEVIAAADEHGIAMVFTSERHFKH